MISLKNTGRNTINLNLSKEYKGFGKSLIIIPREIIKGLPELIREEKEIIRGIKKGLLVILENKIVKKTIILADKKKEETVKKEEKKGIFNKNNNGGK